MMQEPRDFAPHQADDESARQEVFASYDEGHARAQAYDIARPAENQEIPIPKKHEYIGAISVYLEAIRLQAAQQSDPTLSKKDVDLAA